MKKIKKYIDSKYSLLILIGPFLVITFNNSYSFFSLFFFIAVLLATDIQINKLNKKYILLIFILITSFIYSLLIFKDTLYVIHELRFRVFLSIFLLFISFYYYLVFKYSLIKYHNTFY